MVGDAVATSESHVITCSDMDGAGNLLVQQGISLNHKIRVETYAQFRQVSALGTRGLQQVRQLTGAATIDVFNCTVPESQGDRLCQQAQPRITAIDACPSTT